MVIGEWYSGRDTGLTMRTIEGFDLTMHTARHLDATYASPDDTDPLSQRAGGNLADIACYDYADIRVSQSCMHQEEHEQTIENID